MDIHNFITDIHKSVMDTRKSIMDIHNSIYGYPLFGIMDIHKNMYLMPTSKPVSMTSQSLYCRGHRSWHQSIVIMDIHKSNYWYTCIESWLSIGGIMDIHRWNYGYP